MVQSLSLALYNSLSRLSEQNVNSLIEAPLILGNDLPISKLIGALTEKKSL